jgi:hypothetical protein
MTNKGLLIAALAVLLLGGGLLALNFPVFLDHFDQYGMQVECGTGYFSNMTQASVANTSGHAVNYVDECNSALAIRRAWSIPMVAIGLLIIAGLTVELYRHAERTGEASDPDSG